MIPERMQVIVGCVFYLISYLLSFCFVNEEGTQVFLLLALFLLPEKLFSFIKLSI